jgi:hypothetical protein
VVRQVPSHSSFVNTQVLVPAGLTTPMLVDAILYTYSILDAVDNTLLLRGAERMARMVELANLSSMIGNFLRYGIVKASGGVFVASGAHKYQDLRVNPESGVPAENIEIKIALEKHKPKGHLSKSGYYLTCRYVLCDERGVYTPGRDARGKIVHIWELRFGFLNESDFNESNTVGDSGKTAVVNKEGMRKLAVIYCDLSVCPFSPRGVSYRSYAALYPATPLNVVE